MPQRSTRFATRFGWSSLLLAVPLVLAAGAAAGGAHAPTEHDRKSAMDEIAATPDLPSASVPYLCESAPTLSLRDWTLSDHVSGWPHAGVVRAREALKGAAGTDDYDSLHFRIRLLSDSAQNGRALRSSQRSPRATV